MRNLRSWSRTPDLTDSLHLYEALFDAPAAELAKIKIVGLSQHLNEKSSEIARLKRELEEARA